MIKQTFFYLFVLYRKYIVEIKKARLSIARNKLKPWKKNVKITSLNKFTSRLRLEK